MEDRSGRAAPVLNLVQTFVQNLEILASVGDDLEDAVGRRLRLRDPAPSGKGHARPLPIDLHASDVYALVHSTLTVWGEVVAGSKAAPKTVQGLAQYLRRHVDVLLGLDDVDTAADEIAHVTTLALDLVDRPAVRWYAGECSSCSAHLYPETGATAFACEVCGAVQDLVQRRTFLLGLAEDRLETAATLARALTTLGRPVTASSIRGLAHRGKLPQAGTGGRGTPLYRVGDLLEALHGSRPVSD